MNFYRRIVLRPKVIGHTERPSVCAYITNYSFTWKYFTHAVFLEKQALFTEEEMNVYTFKSYLVLLVPIYQIKI